ncbi:MAG TPA: NACHT domain-containing protein [Clostridia bacterium]|nr:NACHT domain-containing protein [Clostridia bacterium]
MSDELDINQIAVDFVQNNLDRIVEAASVGLKGAKNVLRARLKSTYEGYLARLLERHSKAKSFFIRSEPTPIYRFFVPLDLSTEQRKLKKASVTDIAKVSKHSIIMASGGCGKTMLMRHLLIGCIRGGEKVPVFLELRHFNNTPGELAKHILTSLQDNGLEIDEEYLELALRHGHFCLLLDGFDELDFSLRKAVAHQIHHLATKYQGNWVMISSRPDSQLFSLTDFVQFAVDPLDLEAAVTLVQRLPFDDPFKDKFINDLKAHLFERHKSFLSNPLLLSIMLLTYSDIAHIPTKLSLFYSQAYESLFQRHDALKGGFQRQRRSTLDIQEFGKAFAAFCIQSYDKRDFTFSRTGALDYFSNAQSLCQLTYDSSHVLDDSLQAVCLLLENGLDITFAHRSFQEYFAAKFIAGCPQDLKETLIERYAQNVMRDSVMELLYELDPESVESYFVLPVISELKDRINFRGKLGISNQLKFVKWLIREFHVSSKIEFTAAVEDVDAIEKLWFISRHYLPEVSVSPSEHDAWLATTRRLWQEEFCGSSHVTTASLKTTSRLLRHILSATFLIYGASHLEGFIGVGDEIARRHQQRRTSITELLGRRA